MTNLIELPETAHSAEAWRRQIADVCERAGIRPIVRETVITAHGKTVTLRGPYSFLDPVCDIIRRNFIVTPDNLDAVKAGIRLYLGMRKDDVINSSLLMEGK